MSVLTNPADIDVLPSYALYTLVPCISLHFIFFVAYFFIASFFVGIYSLKHQQNSVFATYFECGTSVAPLTHTQCAKKQTCEL